MRKQIMHVFMFFILFCGGLLSAQNQPSPEIVGAGASFPYPLYSKWFDVYAKSFNIKVNYQSIGSGGGIRQLENKTVDFAGSDAYLSDEEMKRFTGGVLHIPTTLGGVALIYNLPIEQNVKLTPEMVVDIYMGKIKNWQDSKLKDSNPDIKFPNLPIVPTYRSDGSGTTFIFTDYLSKVSPEWKEKIGRGKMVEWRGGIGGKGNEGVAGSVKQMPGSIGYVEVIYAEKNHLKFALLKNRAGKFVAPTVRSISEAASVQLPDDLRVSITDTSSPEGYPISGFTWIIVYKEQNYDNRSKMQAIALKGLLKWCITDAQTYSKSLLYSPIPAEAREMALKRIEMITYNQRQF